MLLAVQTFVHLRSVVCVRRRYRHTMHQTLRVGPDMRLHTELPLVALFRRLHLGIALLRLVLR